MMQKKKRDDAAKNNEQVGDVGEKHKKLNQQGEQQRTPSPPDSKDKSST